ncbi:hypothetical protein E5676_scaffold69G00070 [Cucumis melo var. makuwa]|uniref:Uncharacterized protein n=1 Tax=Cucumis melo var. makuwa TaxID=1194695 RepID=A0A5D3BQI1_CUCMM|nr:hypothetical protein E6C27_scaffold83G00860 [Cucumis melo var. makuwa]TYK01320.1 hypothetical protein E5676_scaffold69G00070 [Cucumis melo var. makuwa]
MIRRDHSQPDCLSVSFGYTKDQIVLGVPLGSPKTRYVPTGSQIARVLERASSWVPLFRTLMGSEGKGRGKLASDREGSVTCHMGTQFCFCVYVSVFQHYLSSKTPISRTPSKIEAPLKIQAFFQVFNFKNTLED